MVRHLGITRENKVENLQLQQLPRLLTTTTTTNN